MSHGGFLDFLSAMDIHVSDYCSLQVLKLYVRDIRSRRIGIFFLAFGMLILVMLPKELSYEIMVNTFIFIILLMSRLALSSDANNSPEVTK